MAIVEIETTPNSVEDLRTVTHIHQDFGPTLSSKTENHTAFKQSRMLQVSSQKGDGRTCAEFASMEINKHKVVWKTNIQRHFHTTTATVMQILIFLKVSLNTPFVNNRINIICSFLLTLTATSPSRLHPPYFHYIDNKIKVNSIT